jgi:polyphosphate kinase
VLLASADWMSRNFDRRIELLFGIGKDELKRELKYIMDECWKDDLKSWSLGSDRRYARGNAEDKGHNVQESLIRRYTG